MIFHKQFGETQKQFKCARIASGDRLEHFLYRLLVLIFDFIQSHFFEMAIDETRLELIQGDITQMAVDAIVNAANSSLMGGGGVDGAIHLAGGPSVLEECKKIVARQGECKTGEAVITRGGDLKATFVIHTVGPVWNGGRMGESGKLANCYKNSLRLAAENKCRTIAFPNIST